MFNQIYKNRSVFLTGHTGFKGSWLTLWLKELGAKVTGYSLSPDTTPNHWDMLNLDINDIRADIRDLEKLSAAMKEANPEIVFHLAAQPLVRKSYADPLETWSTNVMGTANLLECCREIKSIKAIVIVTTDKVYANNEWAWGYREVDRLGGYDPYSASKAATELVTDSFRKSFFSEASSPLVASARAGNVIGGGDWSTDRLIPDLVRSINTNKGMLLRSPKSTRPWQHVLDCLSGYLLLGQHLLQQNTSASGAWNFGPGVSDNRTVSDILDRIKKEWPQIEWIVPAPMSAQPHEAGLLYLDSAKANQLLNWKPVWSLDQTIYYTITWYQKYLSDNSVQSIDQLKKFMSDGEQINATERN